MTLREFVVECAKRQGSTKKEAREWVNVVFETLKDLIVEEAKKGGQKTRTIFSIPGVGRLCLKYHPFRKYRSPSKPGETILMPPRYVPRLVVNASLKSLLREIGTGTSND